MTDYILIPLDLKESYRHTMHEHVQLFRDPEVTQRQLYVFMALLGVSRLRVSADPQVLKDRLKLLAVKLRVVP